jgi:murein DD-endopeptidase MepM/ murein hydrolase activator NlpD
VSTVNAIAGAPSHAPPRPSGGDAAARQFEAYLVEEMLKSMQRASPSASSGMDAWGGEFAHAIAGRIAEGKGLGLASQLGRALSGAAAGHGAAVASGTAGPSSCAHAVAGGRITSEFGVRADPVDGSLRHHDGVDVAAKEGSAVRAIAGGVVTRAGEAAGYGLLVEVDHGGGVTVRYAHQRALSVTPGQRVRAGETLGEVGQTGRATGPHLHLEVRVDGRPVDPQHLFPKAFR